MAQRQRGQLAHPRQVPNERSYQLKMKGFLLIAGRSGSKRSRLGKVKSKRDRLPYATASLTDFA